MKSHTDTSDDSDTACKFLVSCFVFGSLWVLIFLQSNTYFNLQNRYSPRDNIVMLNLPDRVKKGKWQNNKLNLDLVVTLRYVIRRSHDTSRVRTYVVFLLFRIVSFENKSERRGCVRCSMYYIYVFCMRKSYFARGRRQNGAWFLSNIQKGIYDRIMLIFI